MNTNAPSNEAFRPGDRVRLTEAVNASGRLDGYNGGTVKGHIPAQSQGTVVSDAGSGPVQVNFDDSINLPFKHAVWSVPREKLARADTENGRNEYPDED